MNSTELQNILKYMKDTYLTYWYNNTLPLTMSKVAEENTEFRLTEKHLQALWNNHNYIQNSLSDDQKNNINIIKLGTWNREPGPDFRKAEIEFNGRRITGDIEIHLTPELWNAHGHQYDPGYNNVILHVVWENNNFNRVPPHIPVVELKSQLSVSPDKIWELTDISNYSKSCIHPAVECSEQINQITDSQLTMVFRAAGLSRLQRKASQFKLSVLKYGLEQALFLALADAHGFKNNRQAFRQLAQAAPLSKLQELPDNSHKKAFLWGKSGLLPDSSQEEVIPELKAFSNNIWKFWWPLRENAETPISWSRASQRPFNSPERRLAALIALLEKCNFQPESMLTEITQRVKTPKLLHEWFNQLFSFNSPWSAMCNFKKKLKSPCRLIGSSRQLDIIVNVFLPAMAYLNQDNSNANEQLYLYYCSLPKCQDNHTLDIARHRFFIPPSRMKHIIRKAIDQQGVMQLMQDFDLPGTPETVIDFWEELGIPIMEKDTDIA